MGHGDIPNYNEARERGNEMPQEVNTLVTKPSHPSSSPRDPLGSRRDSHTLSIDLLTHTHAHACTHALTHIFNKHKFRFFIKSTKYNIGSKLKNKG